MAISDWTEKLILLFREGTSEILLDCYIYGYKNSGILYIRYIQAMLEGILKKQKFSGARTKIQGTAIKLSDQGHSISTGGGVCAVI